MYSSGYIYGHFDCPYNETQMFCYMDKSVHIMKHLVLWAFVHIKQSVHTKYGHFCPFNETQWIILSVIFIAGHWYTYILTIGFI